MKTETPANKVNQTIFRTYDIRGKYPDELNREAAFRIAKAFAKIFPFARKIVLARDPRLSSPRLAEAMIKALADADREIVDIGIAPDPLFYFSIFNYNLDGGIMISGSHKPKGYNGITLNIRKPGNGLPEDVIGSDLELIKQEVQRDKEIYEEGPYIEPAGIKRIDPSNDYISYVTDKFRLKKPLKIIIDSGNGACGFLPERVFKKLGCEVRTIFGEFDGNFPHHLPNPYQEKNLMDIKKEVWESDADLGFAYDTDGDRVAPIDNMGRVISGDFCLLMLARHALMKKKGPIVHCMRASKAFLDEMAKEGAETHFSVSHHNAVIKKILETGAVFGGETTLHFFFPLDYYLYDDALFASLKLAEIAANYDDFAKHVDTLPCRSASKEIFIDSGDDEKFEIIANLQTYLRKNGYQFIDIDGARISFPNGWALARASNTSPVIKFRFEGDRKEDLIEIEKKALTIFKEAGIPIGKKTYEELGLEM